MRDEAMRNANKMSLELNGRFAAVCRLSVNIIVSSRARTHNEASENMQVVQDNASVPSSQILGLSTIICTLHPPSGSFQGVIRIHGLPHKSSKVYGRLDP